MTGESPSERRSLAGIARPEAGETRKATGEGSDARDYFRAVERTFVDLRSGGMFLAPADWDLVRRWEERGIPLDVVLSGIRAAFSGRTRVSSRMSLGECSGPVEAQFDSLRLQQAGAGRPPPDDETESRQRLEQLAAHLRKWSPAAGSLSDPAIAADLVAAACKAAGELDRRARGEGASTGAEQALEEIEDALLIRLQAALADATRAGIENEVRNKLAPYRKRMPESTWRKTCEQAVRRRVGQVFGLGPLTLFD